MFMVRLVIALVLFFVLSSYIFTPVAIGLCMAIFIYMNHEQIP